MIFDRFTKSYEIQTSKPISEILNEVNYRAERQQRKRLLLVSEPVNYSKAIIRENSIEFVRNKSVYNRLKGAGVITFDLESNLNSTSITCTINPTLLNILFDLGFVVVFLIVISISILKDIRELHFTTIIFLGIIWIIMLGIGYLSLVFNTKNLESYSKTILYDLGLLTPNS